MFNSGIQSVRNPFRIRAIRQSTYRFTSSKPMNPEPSQTPSTESDTPAIQTLMPALVETAPTEAVNLLAPYPDEFVVQMLELLNPAAAQNVIERFPSARRQKIMAAASSEMRRQWMRNEAYEPDTIGHMMEPPIAVFRPETTIAEATSDLRHLAKRAFITYAFVADADERLLGVVVMREMLLSEKAEQRLDEIMIREPFAFTPDMSLTEAMKASVVRHFPVYPVCDAAGAARGARARTDAFRSAGRRTQRAAGLDGRCREGRAPEHAVDAQLEVPASVVAAQSAHRVRRRGRRRHFSRTRSTASWCSRFFSRCWPGSPGTPAARRWRLHCAV